VRFGFWIGNSPGGTIADLTIDGVRDHGVIANYGAHDMLYRNLRIVDSGDQFIKSNPNGADGNDRGTVEYSVFEYRTAGNDYYTEAVDVHAGDSWLIRHNLFRNILAPAGQGLAGAAILAWNGSSHTTVEGNTFINVARGISLGLVDKADGFDHQGGIISNNFFYRDSSLAARVDVPIMVADSPNTKIFHNSILVRGSYPNAIEYRFSSSSGLQIRNNLTDAVIQARDGAAASVSGNTTNAQLGWFVNTTAGNLHLVSTAPVINQASVLSDVPLDIDGESRGGNPDVGADEHGGTAADTTPPTISSIAAGGITASGATVTWTTNEASNTQVEYGLTTAYGSQTTLDSSMVTSHSAQLSGLTAGTLYHYRVKSRDAAGNLSVSADRTFTTAAAPDTTPPVISSIAAGSITASGATVTWTTNEASNTQVEYGLTTSYGSQTTLDTSMVTSHGAQLSGLTAGSLYHYRVKSRDAAGNLSVSADRTLTTAAAPDTTPPTISSIAAGSITTSGATVTWTTNEASNTQVEYGLTSSYGSQTTLNTSMVTSHSAQLSGLTAGTLYHYRVKSRDAAGNLSVSADRTLTTAAAPDTTPPTISSIAAGSITTSGATVTWTTNEASNTQVEYGLTTAYGSQTTLDSSMVTSHSAQLSGLTAGTLYHYRVKSRDAAGNLSVSANGTFTTTAAPQGGYSYDNPPPLPPSNPATTVNVSNVSQLIAAVNNLQSGQAIRLAAGTYNLSGVTDALYIPQGISNWAIRGATGDRDDVVIRGAGMSGSVRFGIWIGNSPGGTVADLTIDGVQEHGIIVNSGSHDLLVHNVRVVDSGTQFIKVNPTGSHRGIVEYSVFEYRTTDNDNYTNGIGLHASDGWTIRYNLFRNFLSPAGQGLAGPAILAWDASSNTTVEGNTFSNVARGVSLGLVDRAGGFDHRGGVIRNNFFYRDPSLSSAVDVPIMVADSPDTHVLHNTILNRGSYPNAIEYRFPSSSRLQIRNNLTDGTIQARDGARATVRGNNTSAQLSWFVNPTAGDLHLLPSAPVVDGGSSVLARATLDVDGQARDRSPDIGADEFVDSASLGLITTQAASSSTASSELLAASSLSASDLPDDLSASELFSAGTVVNVPPTSTETDEAALVDLLAEKLAMELTAEEAQGTAEPRSLGAHWTEAVDAVWEEFG
jgi:hypothetical protein